MDKFNKGKETVASKFKTAIVMTALGATLLSSTSMTAFAADETKVTSIPLEIESNIDEREDITDVIIKENNKYFNVTDWEITNEPNEHWEDGDKPKLKIKVEIEDADEAYFDTELDKNDIKVTLKSTHTTSQEATVTKVTRGGKNKVYIYVTLPAVGDGEYNLGIPEVYWEEDSAYAYWEEAEDAKSYELKLYRNDKLLTSKSLTTSGDGYDFSEYFTEKGDYKYKIRAVYNKTHKGEWVESDEMEIKSDEVNKPSLGQPSVNATDLKNGTWIKDSKGWMWLNTDKTWAKDGWKKINNKDYYFTTDGYMYTGWMFDNSLGNWYHLSEDGDKDINKIVSGCKLDSTGKWVSNENSWFQWGKDWYFFGAKGELAKNQWVNWKGIWYYLGDTGRMLTNTTTPDGYKVDANGAWIQ